MKHPVGIGVAVLALAAASVPIAAGVAQAGDDRIEGVPRFDHVYVIVGENTSLSQLDRKSAPYQLGTLKSRSAWFTDYWGISHWSTSNYIAMVSGQYLECHQMDEKPATCHQTGTPNLFAEMDQAGVTWKEWNESMPGGCWLVNAGTSNDLNSYRPKHNPAAYFGEVVGSDFSGTQGSADCQERVVTMGGTGPNDTSAFDDALAAGGLPTFNMILPNMCEDGHDNCKPQGNPIRQFDDFLAREIPQILASPDFTSHSVIVVTYDEGQDGGPGKAKKFDGGHIPTLVLGASIYPGSYGSTLNHYNLLRTLEDGLGITTHAGTAGDVGTLGNIWK